ncbi:hypothetical protein SMICM304S_03950 [Streptomyces microflavus]
MHQDVDPGLLLEGEHLADLVLDALLVPGSWIRPALKSARAVRSSVVCGNEPIVVVGSSGRPRWARWATVRSAYGWERRPSASVIAAVRARTAGSRVMAASAREARSARLAASSAAMASVPPDRPRARTTISWVFCLAKASQRAICGSMSCSAPASSGTCRSELEAETSTWSARPRRVPRVARDFS